MIIGIVCYPTFGGSGVLATELGVELSKKYVLYSNPAKNEYVS